jgi:hypothetical protein
MLTRRLAIVPRPGTAHPSGATVHHFTGGGQLAIVHSSAPLSEREHGAFVGNLKLALRRDGFQGTWLIMPPGHEFTLAEVDDGAPARWEEDGLPSYAALQLRVDAQRDALEVMGARVKELEAREAARGGGAVCGPAFRVMP